MTHKKREHNTIELCLVEAWQKQSPWLWLLSPLAWLYAVVSKFNQKLYECGVLSVYHAGVPVLVVGNITVGGSGKTPLIIALVNYLQSIDVKVAVISRGYGRQADDVRVPALVATDSSPDEVGDEPCLIVQSTGVPMAVGADRGRAIELLLGHYPDIAMIISDDGLQHHALARHAEWIVVDKERGFGNNKLLPQGFLREPVSRLTGATVVYHDTKPNTGVPTMFLKPAELVPLLGLAKSPPSQTTVYAVSGIGYPMRFFNTLRGMGFDVVEQAFGDHHQFVLADLLALQDYPMITTTKDAVKLRQLAHRTPHGVFGRIWVLPVQAVLSDEVYQQMNALLGEWGLS